MRGWLDLLTEGDPHPRRFDGAVSLRAYLLRIERLSEAAADTLIGDGRVEPPLARRSYQVRPLVAPAPAS